MKKMLLEIVFIVCLSILIALIYNSVSTNGIPLITKNKEEMQAPDSLLFQNIFEDTTQVNSNDSAKNIISKIDSSSVSKKDTIKQDSSVKITKSIFENAKKSNQGDYLTVSYEQMKVITNNYEKFVIIDARRQELYATSHIPHAINICPLEDEETVINQIMQLPQNKALIIYCDGGSCELSHDIATLLANFGYKRFFIYEGGWDDWTKNNKKQ